MQPTTDLNHHPLAEQQVKVLLQQQILQVDSYIEYLAAIKQSISGNDNDTLQRLVENPPDDAPEIELNQQQQLQILAAAGFTDKEQALDAFIEQSHQREELEGLRQSLKKSLKQLEQSLFINTLLLQKSQHRVKQSIRLLSGHDLSATPSSYSREGATATSDDNKHIIAEA